MERDPSRSRRSPRPFPCLLACASLLILGIGALPVAAGDHRQTFVTFDHKGGNEWWVEVKVTPGPEEMISGVYARDDGGEWKELTLRSWGNYAGSFHIEPGHRVEFQAYRAGGMSDAWRETSCKFTHPAGVEQCEPAPTFTAHFNPAFENGFVRLGVEASQPVAKVEYTLDGGPRTAMAHESNGPQGPEYESWWTASTNAREGAVFRFFATSTTGAEVASTSCYRTDAGAVPCDDPFVGPVFFDHKGGNEWWVEAYVTGGVASVEARDTDGQWTPLAKKSWGNWAASFRIEPGHQVMFRADKGNGQWLESCWFTHPQGVTPTGGSTCEGRLGTEPDPDPSTFDATFSNARGNEWWVEVDVAANEPLAKVEAKVNDGAYVMLEKKSWGSWAKSVHAPAGSMVTFRATSADGDTDTASYRWPPS